MGDIALVSGASRGLGLALALALASRGARVVALGRDVEALDAFDERCAELGYERPFLVAIDVRDEQAILRLEHVLAERYGGLDWLIGNAGVLGALSPVGSLEWSGWREVFEINCGGNFLLMRACESLLLARSGQAWFVTSGAARLARPYWSFYASSKAALEVMVRCWRGEFERRGVAIGLLDPGVAATSMRATAFPGEDPSSLPSAARVAELFLARAVDKSARHEVILQLY